MKMEDLSLHILDIVENSIEANASKIIIRIDEDIKGDWLTIEIKDNGRGMDETTVKRVLDPFYTTRTTRKVGLGLSLLAQSAKESGGYIEIKSKPGEGTEIKVAFRYSNIDRKPLGDINETLMTLVIGNPGINFIYEYQSGDTKFGFDTSKM